jgi:hypothetical protein
MRQPERLSFVGDGALVLLVKGGFILLLSIQTI